MPAWMGLVLFALKKMIMVMNILLYTSAERSNQQRKIIIPHIKFALKKFRPYILGQTTNIFTDHQPLVHIRDTKEMSGRLARWLLYMEPYAANGNLAIIYKPGSKNANADALSRLVCMLGKVSRHTGGQAGTNE